MDLWVHLAPVRDLGSGRLATEVELSAELTWFDGHFPGNPVLPGVALLAMASEMARGGWAARQLPVVLRELRAVRFKQVLSPGMCLRLGVDLVEENERLQARFEAHAGDELACRATLLFERCSAGPTNQDKC